MSNSVSALYIFNGIFMSNIAAAQMETLISTQKQAVLDLIILPNYTIYDPNGTDPAPTLPETLTAEWWIIQPTPSAALATYESWQNSVGVRAGLTALKSDLSSLVNCTARLESISDITPTNITGTHRKVRGVFVPLTNWVDV